MNKSIIKIIQISAKRLWLIYIIFGIIVVGLIGNIVAIVLSAQTGGATTIISSFDLIIGIVPISAVVLPRQMDRLKNIGAKKVDILNSHFLILGIFSFLCTVIPIIYNKLVDKHIATSKLAKEHHIKIIPLWENSHDFSNRGFISGHISWMLFIFVISAFIYLIFTISYAKLGPLMWIILMVYFFILYPIFGWAKAILSIFNILTIYQNIFMIIICDVIFIAIFYWLSRLSILIGKSRHE
jgi:hypothetical protein